jgi:hypothetical protein
MILNCSTFAGLLAATKLNSNFTAQPIFRVLFLVIVKTKIPSPSENPVI